MKKIRIDKNKCIGCGTCVATAPKHFKLGEDDKAQVIEPTGDSKTTVKEAIENCPVEAIELVKNS